MVANPRPKKDPNDPDRLNDAFSELQAGQAAASGAQTTEEKQDILGQYANRAEDLGGSKNAGVVRSAGSAGGGGDAVAADAQQGQQGAADGKGPGLAGTLGKMAGIALIVTDVVAVVGLVAAPFTAGGSLALSAGALAAKQALKAGMRAGVKKAAAKGGGQMGKSAAGRFGKNMLGTEAKYGLGAGIKRLFGRGTSKTAGKSKNAVAKPRSTPAKSAGKKQVQQKPSFLSRVGRGIKNGAKRVLRTVRRNIMNVMRGVMKLAGMYVGAMAMAAGGGNAAASHGGKVNAGISGLNAAKQRQTDRDRSPAMGQQVSKMGLRSAAPAADQQKISQGKEMQQSNARSDRESTKKSKGGRDGR